MDRDTAQRMQFGEDGSQTPAESALEGNNLDDLEEIGNNISASID
jgi:hypothetical protein